MEFPTVIDSTIRSAFIDCPTKGKYEFMENLAPERKSIHLVAGGAFAAGLEAARKAFYVQGKSTEEAIKAAAYAAIESWGDYVPADPDSPKVLPRVIEAIGYYFSQWPLGSDHIEPWTNADGSRCIEFSFALPLPIAHPETGDPILYGGRCDMIARHASGICLVEDEKTTSQLGASWLNKWNMRGQFYGYCYGAREHGYPVSGFLVRGISFLKRGFGNAEVLVQLSDWQLDNWYRQMLRDVERMKQAYVSGIFDQAFGEACASYGTCPYTQLCTVKDPTQWYSNYVKREWRPLQSVD